MVHLRIRLIALFLVCLAIPTVLSADESVAPDKMVSLFNGKDLTGWRTWLRATGHDDPQRVFTVQDGLIHMLGGEHRGYIATEKMYRDYHFSVEYKWGNTTDGGKYVRNSGVLVHATGKDGGAGKNTWMPSIEVQLAQGCEGDFIVIRGVDDNGDNINVDLASHVRVAEDKKTRWDPKGEKVKYSGKQFWWNNHMPFFEELLDTRGNKDVASPVGEWTRVEVIARGSTMTVKINGHTVNEAVDVFPAAGHILLQNEGHEVWFRNVEIAPLSDKPK